MAGIKEKTDTYVESDAKNAVSDSRPILAEGIGRRISEVAALLGSRISAYTIMGVSSAALQRYIKGENMPPFDVVARLCIHAGVRMEWLATGDDPMLASETSSDSGSQPTRPNMGTLQEAAEVLERALDKADATTDSTGRAELLVAIYELLEQGSAIDAAERVVVSMLRVASRAAGTPAKQG